MVLVVTEKAAMDALLQLIARQIVMVLPEENLVAGTAVWKAVVLEMVVRRIASNEQRSSVNAGVRFVNESFKRKSIVCESCNSRRLLSRYF